CVRVLAGSRESTLQGGAPLGLDAVELAAVPGQKNQGPTADRHAAAVPAFALKILALPDPIVDDIDYRQRSGIARHDHVHGEVASHRAATDIHDLAGN